MLKLMEAVRGKVVSPGQAIQDIDNLMRSGYRISDEIVGDVKKNLQRWEQ
jgi:hypothetical protein